MNTTVNTFRILQDTNLLAKELCEIVVEYMYSIYFDECEFTVKFVSDSRVESTIKNKKLYLFDRSTFTLTIIHMYDRMPYNPNSIGMFVGTEYIYVHHNGIIYIFNEQCKNIRNINITHQLSYLRSIDITVSSNKICVYCDEEFHNFMCLFDMQGNFIQNVQLSSIWRADAVDDIIYVLTRTNEIHKLSSDGKIIDTFSLGKDNLTEYFHTTANEIYVFVRKDNYQNVQYVHVYDHNKNFLRSVFHIDQVRSKYAWSHTIFDDNNTYHVKYNFMDLNGLIRVYVRNKIKFY